MQLLYTNKCMIRTLYAFMGINAPLPPKNVQYIRGGGYPSQLHTFFPVAIFIPGELSSYISPGAPPQIYISRRKKCMNIPPPPPQNACKIFMILGALVFARFLAYGQRLKT